MVNTLGRGVRSLAFGVGDADPLVDTSKSKVPLNILSVGSYLMATSVCVVSRLRIAQAFSLISTSARLEIIKPAGGIREKGGGETFFKYASSAVMDRGIAAFTLELTAAGPA